MFSSVLELMNNKNAFPYVTPAVLGLHALEIEVDFLDGSVVDPINNGGVNTSGQDTEDIDFGEGGFNHNWN